MKRIKSQPKKWSQLKKKRYKSKKLILQPKGKSKRVIHRRFELQHIKSFSTLTFQRLLEGKIKPRKTTRVEEPLCPNSTKALRKLIEDKANARAGFILRNYKNFPDVKVPSTLPKWDLLRARGFTLIISLPLLYRYKEYRQGYAKLVHILFDAIMQCANSPINTPIKFELLTRKMVLIRTETSLELRTTSTWAIWNVCIWWGVQFAITMVNLFPLFFGKVEKPLEVRWNLCWSFWCGPNFNIIPLLNDFLLQHLSKYCRGRNLSLKHGLLFFIIDKLLTNDDLAQNFHDTLQFIFLNMRGLGDIRWHTKMINPYVFGIWNPIPPKLEYAFTAHSPMPKPNKLEEQVLVYIKWPRSITNIPLNI